MEKPIIEVKNIGKKYNITHQRGGYIALRDVLMNVLKSPFKFLKSKAKQAIGVETKEDFWALSGISFNVQKGEVIGIIGGNGAGKSTLLKILSQITPPTTGEIKIRGRVGSLLEVGTGFHPELTGRENIFLNGAILGMKKKEIAKKFDEIVTFAGIEKFLDTPVKYYSSGMYVRLAFSVAAHMEPDILIIDEVLAVGDAEFQKKCLGKMEDITKEDGRTILFVSHNMAAIQQLCQKCVLLENGSVKKIGETTEVIDYYLSAENKSNPIPLKDRKDRRGNQNLKFTNCYFVNNEGIHTNQIVSGENITLVMEYECKKNVSVSNVVIGAVVVNENGQSLFICHNGLTKTDFGNVSGSGSFKCNLKKIPLTTGKYYINIRVIGDEIELDYISNIFSFEVISVNFFGNGSNIHIGQFYVEQEWKIQN